MADRILEAVREGRVTTHNVSAVEVLGFRAATVGGFERLDRGRAVIDRPEDLDQYLWSYGKMVAAQWAGVLQFGLLRQLPFDRFGLTDVGCGQGLSTTLFLDHLRGLVEPERELADVVSRVRLYDASRLALRRAQRVTALYRLPVSAHAVVLPHVAHPATPPGEIGRVTILSNILDIEGFDLELLRLQLFAPGGRHLVVAVSNNRNVAGGGARVQAFRALLERHHRVLASEEKAWEVEMVTRTTDVVAFACLMES